jgi:arginase
MWALAGVPIDSSGRGRGEANAPAVLREAGVGQIAGVEDRGDIEARIADPVRDPHTGVIGIADLVRASAAIANWVAGTASEATRILLIGGDCALLPGVFAGLRRSGIEASLCMIDGHADTLDGSTSPTGEAADMELAFLLGRAPESIAVLAGPRPLLGPERVVLLGHRPGSLDPEVARELGLLPEGLTHLDAPSILELGAGDVGRETAKRLSERPAWIHLDLDVLDEAVFPAVTYPQPLGLDWHALRELIEPLIRTPSLAGISVADLEPGRDPERCHTRRVVEFLADVLA